VVRGEGRYVGDVSFPGMAYGYVLRSQHAHARIVSLNTDKAKAAPGRAGSADRRGLGSLRVRRSAGSGGLKRAMDRRSTARAIRRW